MTEQTFTAKDNTALTEAILTLPIEPKRTTILIYAEGIKPEPSEADQEYLAECLQKGVLPHTTYHLDWNGNSKRFLPQPITISYRVEETYPSFIRGGKIHRIEMETELFGEGFQEIRNELLPQAISKGYTIARANIWLDIREKFSTIELTDYEPTATLKLDGMVPELTLQPEGLPDQERTKVISWFEALVQKHAITAR